MVHQRIDAKWIDAIVQVFRLCGVRDGEAAAILSQTQSRPVNVQLAELALLALGARAFAGNFLYSTGANEVAGRHIMGRFDLPLRGCTVTLDDTVVVECGQLQGTLA